MRKPPVRDLCVHGSVQTLRARGLRATAQRVAVLDLLPYRPHTDAEAVFQAVRPSLPTISLQAIYLIVQALSGASKTSIGSPATLPVLIPAIRISMRIVEASIVFAAFAMLATPRPNKRKRSRDT